MSTQATEALPPANATIPAAPVDLGLHFQLSPFGAAGSGQIWLPAMVSCSNNVQYDATILGMAFDWAL